MVDTFEESSSFGLFAGIVNMASVTGNFAKCSVREVLKSIILLFIDGASSQVYAPKLRKKLAWYSRKQFGCSWGVDETYIKVSGKWVYLYRAIDRFGNTIDFYLSTKRNKVSAKRFLQKALGGCDPDSYPTIINTDKHASYKGALKVLKKERRIPQDIEIRQVKYLNNRIESDHGKLKRLIKPCLGFKSMTTAWNTIQGFEAMRMFKKGQMDAWLFGDKVRAEVHLMNRVFGI